MGEARAGRLSADPNEAPKETDKGSPAGPGLGWAGLVCAGHVAALWFGVVCAAVPFCSNAIHADAVW